MSSDLLQTLAEELARDTLKQAALTDDEGLVDDVAKSLGDTSTTFEEAFLTAVRFYRAEARARQLLPDFQHEDAIALPPPEKMEEDRKARESVEEPEEEEEIPYAEAEIVDEDEDRF